MNSNEINDNTTNCGNGLNDRAPMSRDAMHHNDVDRNNEMRNADAHRDDKMRNRDADHDEDMRHGSANRDPITDAPGFHPVGTGVGGALGGAAAGAAVGTVAGPVGMAIGAAVGVVAGGLAGKGVAEAMDPTREDSYWRDNYRDRPYVAQDSSYDDYGPAYAFGTDSANRNQGRSFEDAEPELEMQWPDRSGKSSLSWDKAREPARDAWHRGADTL